MSYASQTREELARLPLGEPCCAAAEVAGMIAAGGVLSLSGGGGRSLSLDSEQAAVTRRVFSLLRRAWDMNGELQSYHRDVQGARDGYRLVLRDADATLAMERAGLGALALDAAPPEALLGKLCCRRAYLRGAFLMSGTLGAPDKGYHMEWRLSRPACAQGLNALLAGEDIVAGISQRRDRYVLYLKDAERISDALAVMGAVEALLRLENVRVVKDIRNRVNRRSNCDNANIDKAMDAARRQIEAIRYLEEKGILPRLSQALRITAELRVEYDMATIEELGGYFVPPVGKSAVNHRLRRLQAIAREHRENDEEGMQEKSE